MTPSKFIATLFQSRDYMHIAHLQTTSFAEHKALDSYYGSILELTDEFCETFFGREGRVPIVIPESKYIAPIDHLRFMSKTLEEERVNYTSELQNIIDEMLGVVNRTIYMLSLM